MSYEKLSIKGFINEVKDVSSGPHPRKFCFVLGAGASISSGIKSGQELVNIWDRELQERNAEEHLKWKKDLKITEDNKYSFYSRFYERRFRRQPADGYNYLEKLMEHAKPSVGYVMLSYLLTKTKHNIVITTNFDHLTEDAVNYYAQTIPLVIGHESLAHYVNKQINRPTVIKIHRDLLFDPKNTTDELEILHENWKKALGAAFSYKLQTREEFLGDAEKRYLELSIAIDKFTETSVKQTGEADEDGEGAAIEQVIEEITSQTVQQRLYREAVSLYNSDKYKEALVIEKKLVELNQINPFYHHNVGNTLHELKRYEEAEEEKRKATKLEPTNAEYHDSLSVTLHIMGKYEEAAKETRKAIELEPTNAKYHDSLGITLHEMGSYEEAEKEKRKAIKLEPTNAGYHNSLGITLQRMGRYKEAEEETRKATELDAGNQEYSYNLDEILKAIKKQGENK